MEELGFTQEMIREAAEHLQRKERIKSMITAPFKKLVVDKKYIKTKSLTWWLGFAPLLGGVAMAVEDVVPGASFIVAITQALTDLEKQELIWLGLGMIGVRGALK